MMFPFCRALSWLAAAGLLLSESLLFAGAPEVTKVHPDQASRTNMAIGLVHTITGGNFEQDGLEIWVWRPPESERPLEEVLSDVAVGAPSLPIEPPEGARRVQPLDVEPRVLMVPLNPGPGPQRAANVVWLKNAVGVSDPYLFNVAQPRWINDARFEQGDLIRVFGAGLWIQHGPPRSLVLRDPESGTVTELQPMDDVGIDRSPETRLSEAFLPVDLPPGEFDVFVHNGLGGEFGWALAGRITVSEKNLEAPRVFDAREFGAKGDGFHDDTSAIQKAVDAAVNAGGGEVRLSPGTYRTTASIFIREGVRLLGSGRENTIVHGMGFDPAMPFGRQRWNFPLATPSSVLLMESHTGLADVTVRGSVSSGAGGVSLVQAHLSDEELTWVIPELPPVERISIDRVALESDGDLYTAAFSPGPTFWSLITRHIRIADSLIDGNISLGLSFRSDILRNQVRGGSVINASGLVDAFIDENVMRDGPARFFSYTPVRNSYFRSNEIYTFGRRSNAGGAEAFMFHGGPNKFLGQATDGSETTLVDTRQEWVPDAFEGQIFTVLITAGTGFGQYRQVAGNTKDTIEVEQPWRVPPDETSEYLIARLFTDSVFFDNYQDHLAQMWLWFDCINVEVENHRDDHGGGIDLFGIDSSSEQRRTIYAPSWFNVFTRNQMHGSRIALWGEDGADTLYRGPILFANYLLDNQIVRPAMRPIGDNVRRVTPQAGIDFNYYLVRHHEPTGRISHTVAMNNVITDTETGIRVARWARKTFLLGNIFINVKNPVLDAGSGTILRENIVESYSEEDGEIAREPIPDQTGEDPLQAIIPTEGNYLYLPPEQSPVGAFARGGLLERFIAAQAYYNEEVQSEEIREARQEALGKLHDILLEYEKEHGVFPDAVFYPASAEDEQALGAILGEEAAVLLRAPGAGPDFARLGWPTFLWNANLSGKTRSEIDPENPQESWLLLDLAAAHRFLVQRGFAGSLQGVNVLRTDGTVDWLDSSEEPIGIRVGPGDRHVW